MAITTMDGLISALASSTAQQISISKATFSGTIAQWHSCWVDTGFPTAGSAAGSAAGAACYATTTGAIYIVDATTNQTLYLAAFGGGGSQIGQVQLWDRLVHTSALSGTVTTSQTVNSTALPARAPTNGVGVKLFVEWYTATGSTGVNITVRYLDQAGATQTAVVTAIPASMKAEQLLPIPLAAGSTGIRSVIDCILSASTGTAGNFGFTLGVPIGPVGTIGVAGGGFQFDAIGCNLADIPNGACLWLVEFQGNASTPALMGAITIVSG